MNVDAVVSVVNHLLVVEFIEADKFELVECFRFVGRVHVSGDVDGFGYAVLS